MEITAVNSFTRWRQNHPYTEASFVLICNLMTVLFYREPVMSQNLCGLK